MDQYCQRKYLPIENIRVYDSTVYSLINFRVFLIFGHIHVVCSQNFKHAKYNIIWYVVIAYGGLVFAAVLDPANTLSEHCAVAVLCHMMSHDYHMVISDVKKGETRNS